MCSCEWLPSAVHKNRSWQRVGGVGTRIQAALQAQILNIGHSHPHNPMVWRNQG